MSEIIDIPFRGGKIFLRLPSFQDLPEINAEKLIRIREDKLLLELITFPVILNRLGIVLAEAESELSRSLLDLKIVKSQVKKESRIKLFNRGDKVTDSTVEDEYRTDPKYKAISIKHINCQKKRDYVNSLYWAAKDKSDKLNKLADKIIPDDLVIDKMNDEFNGIKILVKEDLIK